jgi:hypothetical protein
VEKIPTYDGGGEKASTAPNLYDVVDRNDLSTIGNFREALSINSNLILFKPLRHPIPIPGESLVRLYGGNVKIVGHPLVVTVGTHI